MSDKVPVEVNNHLAKVNVPPIKLGKILEVEQESQETRKTETAKVNMIKKNSDIHFDHLDTP